MRHIDDLGKIIIIRNIKFVGHDGKKCLDHAYQNGRPCVIMGELDEYYLVPMTTKKYYPPLSNYYVPIVTENFKAYADSKIIIKHNIFFANPIGRVNIPTYYHLICKILECDRMTTPELLDEIYDELVCQKDNLEKKYSYHL